MFWEDHSIKKIYSICIIIIILLKHVNMKRKIFNEVFSDWEYLDGLNLSSLKLGNGQKRKN